MTIPLNESRPRPRPNFDRAQPKDSTVKGHDAVLKALQNDGRQITVVYLDGSTLSGGVVARDKYTISVRVDGGRRIVVVFKHAIASFYGEEKSTKAAD